MYNCPKDFISNNEIRTQEHICTLKYEYTVAKSKNQGELELPGSY